MLRFGDVFFALKKKGSYKFWENNEAA
jgi:hypothetical protein